MMRIELTETSHGWFVRSGDKWEANLCTDEALGVVASLLYSGRAPYLRTAIQHALWESRYGAQQPILPERIAP